MTDFRNKYSVLQDFFGHSQFRNGQEQIIDSILAGRDCLGVMPTGAGKSMCYQIPALMFDGITIVVSPLISLMKDQVNSLIQSGVRAAYLNSSLTAAQYEMAISNAARGMYKIIYVAPERLMTGSFLSLASSVKISMLAVDEAHCVSQWGQDFRPSYMKIPEFLGKLPYRPIVSAFTATATAEVKADIIKMLELRDPFTITTGFDRKNLYFGVSHPHDKYSEAVRIVEKYKDNCGIIYCSTRKNVESVCEKLCADGYNASRYHAGLSDEERRKNQDDFIFDRVQVMVATNAFGMGIDKSNVSYVIHYNMPKNIESYYQEAGRAGRDGNEAKCILLYSGQDVATNKFLINNSHDNPDLDDDTLEMIRKRDLMRLKKMTDYCNTNGCLREFILGYFGEKQDKPCQNCSGCLGDFGETEEVDVSVDCQKVLSCIYRLHQRNLSFGAGVIAQILKGSDSEKVKRFDLSTLSTYGIMKDSTQVYIRRLIAFLEADDYITQTSHGDFSVLTLTRRSAEILMDKKTITIRLPKKKPKSETVTKIGRDEVTTFDKELFGRLRAVRSKLATQASLPAYIILTDASLRDMCIKLPKTQTELLNISGVGKSKQERYGRYFVAEIQKYLKENPDAASGYKYIPEGYLQKQNAVGGQSTKEYIIAHAGELSGKEQDMTLSEVCDSIFYQLGTDGDIRSIKLAIKEWLIGENYLAKDGANGRGFLETTILSPEAGIIEREKISQLGNSYKTILFPKQAQEFIFDNIEEILSKDAQNS